MSVSSSSTASLLSVETALQELVQVAGASSSSDSIQNEVNEWVNEFNRLTKSFASPDHRELQELFGEDKIHSIYSAVPLPSLSVTAAFIRAVQNNRLAALLAKPPSQLSAAEQSTKALWEGTICSIVNSVVDWFPAPEDNKEAAPHVGRALYQTLCPFLTENFSKRVGDDVKKAIAELLEQTVAGCKPNKLLLSDTTKGTGFLKIKTIGELFFSSTHTSHPLPSAYLDLIAHLNPRLKEPELRTKHAEIAFKSFEGALGEKLKKLLVETPNSEWYSTRAKLLTAVAQSDVNRLQLFPLLSVHRSSTGNLDLLDNEEDRDSIETGIKFLYLDAEGMIYTVNEDGEESTRVPFKEVVKTTFKEEEAGADQTTLMTCETKNQGVFKFKLKCSRADIQRVCARRPFATPIDSPIAKYDRRRASVPVGAPLVLPDSPIAGAEGSGEEEEQEKEVFQQPPTPVEAITTTSDQAKVPPPSPRKPLSSAASSSSFVKKKIPPPHLNLDLGDHHLQKQPPSSSPASTTTVGKQPKAKPKSTSTQPPAAPSKPTSSSKIAKLSKLSPPKAPQLDSSLFGKGNESDSELSEVSTVGPSQSQSQGQVTTGWKRKRVVEASQEEEVEEEEKAGKKKPKTTTKTPRLHEEEEEDDDDLDLLNNNNDDDDDDGGGTSLAAPPTKQPVPRKTYGSSSARKKSTSISATPNSKSTSRKSLVGFMKPKSKAKANVASSRSSPFPDLPSSPNSNHIGGGKGDETDEYDDLPSIPRGAKMNPITAARREPAPRGGKGKAKGGKTTKETGKKAAGKKETIDISDSDENDDGTTTKKTSGGTALRNKSKSSNVASPRDGEAAGGRKSLRKSAVVARKRFGSAAREEEEEMQVERGKTDRKGKGKEKKEPTPDAYSYPADDDMGNNFANDTGSNVNSPSTRNDFLLSQTNSNANSQAFAYEESQAVFGGAMFKSQTSNSNASDEMDVLGNDTNDRAGDGDVRMDDDDDAEEVAPMPDPLKFVDEDINLVLSGEVGNSMPLGKKRMGSKDLGEERLKKKGITSTPSGAVDRAGAIEEEDVEMEVEVSPIRVRTRGRRDFDALLRWFGGEQEDGDKTIVQQKNRSLASSSTSKGQSFASVATAGTSAKSSKVPSPVKARNGSDSGTNSEATEKQLTSTLDAAGMSRGIDQSRPIKALPSNASSNRSRAPLSPPIAISSRSSSHQVATAKPRSNQIDAKKKVGALPPAKKSGTRVVDSDSEEIEEDSIDENASEEIEEDEEEVVRSAHWPIKETPKTSTRKTSKAAPSDGPKAHSAPTITPRNVRINSKPDYMGSDPQPAAAASSSTKTRPASLAASEPSKTTPVPRQSSSASSSQRKEVQHPFVEAEQQQQRVDVEQDQESGTSSRSQSQPSSSKKSAWTSQAPPPTPRASHIVRLPQPPPAAAVGPAPKVVVDRSPTPQPRHPSVVNDQEEEQPEAARLRSASPQNRRVVDRHRGVDRSGQGSAAPPSVPRKPVKELADLVERLEDREEEEGTNLLKHTLDIIVTELNMRYSSRVKKTQFKAKETRTRLTSDTQKLSLHLVGRTTVIVDASKRHAGKLKQLNSNFAATAKEARLKSEDVVKEMERAVAREERRNDQWPTSFFA